MGKIESDEGSQDPWTLRLNSVRKDTTIKCVSSTEKNYMETDNICYYATHHVGMQDTTMGWDVYTLS